MPIDPICHMQVDESTPLKAQRDGQTFYFCSEHCRRRFLGEGKPLLQLALPEPAAIPLAGYTCPMHPEVVQDRSGACPICGMDLESTHIAADSVDDDTDLRKMTNRLLLAVLLGLPVLVLAMLPMIGFPHQGRMAGSVSRWLQLWLTTPVVLWAGWPFFQRGWRSIVTWNLNMFTLIALGIGTAYVYSVVAVVFPSSIPVSFRHGEEVPVYFEAAAAITALVLLGQVLELRARRRTGSAIRELLTLTPPTARIVSDGHEMEVPLETVRPGDLLRVRPAPRFPSMAS